jgi:hypothetical protein
MRMHMRRPMHALGPPVRERVGVRPMHALGPPVRERVGVRVYPPTAACLIHGLFCLGC